MKYETTVQFKNHWPLKVDDDKNVLFLAEILKIAMDDLENHGINGKLISLFKKYLAYWL